MVVEIIFCSNTKRSNELRFVCRAVLVWLVKWYILDIIISSTVTHFKCLHILKKEQITENILSLYYIRYDKLSATILKATVCMRTRVSQ